MGKGLADAAFGLAATWGTVCVLYVGFTIWGYAVRAWYSIRSRRKNRG